MSETLPTIAPDVMDAWKSDVRRRRQELEAEKIRQQANRERIYRESTPSLGESIQLGNRVGLPPDVVDRNAKDIRAREASTILNPRNDPYTQRFLETALGQFAARDPEGFRRMDDTLADPSHQFIPGAWDFGYVFPDPNTKKIPPWAEVFSKNWEAGWQYVEVGSLGTKYLAGKANEEEILRYLNSEPVEIPDRPGWSDELAGLLIQNVPQILPMVQGAAAGTAIGSFVGLGVGQPVPGAIFGARIGAAVGVFPLHLGNTYLEYHRLASEISVPGPIGPGEVIPDGVVRGTAMAAALIATALDTVGASLIVGRHGRKASQEKMVKLLRSRKLRPLVTELAKRYAKSARDEGLTEFFQELEIAAFGEVLIQVMTEQEGDFFSEDTVYRLLTALAGGAVLGLVMGGVGETAVIAAKKKVANALNEQENERLTAQKEAIDESPFSVVDPPQFQTFLQASFEANGASPEIYIDAKTLVEFFDEKKIDVEQFKMDMPDIFTQLPAALAANADVSISRASYLTYLRDHHETLLPHIRHGVALLTGSEIANTTDELEDDVAASLRALIDEAAAIDPTETTAPSEFDVIEQKMEQKLIDAGQRPSVARFQAKLYRARAERRAPGPLEVVGPDGEPTTPDLEQAAVDATPGVVPDQMLRRLRKEVRDEPLIRKIDEAVEKSDFVTGLEDSEFVSMILRGDTEGIAEQFLPDGFLDVEFASAAAKIRSATQEALVARGLPDEFLVYRGGNLPEGAIVGTSLDYGGARGFAHEMRLDSGTVKVFRVSRSDVDADIQSLFSWRWADENELLISSDVLRGKQVDEVDAKTRTYTPRAEAPTTTLEQAQVPEGVEVKGAAIRLPDGTIVEGATHGEAMAEAQRRGILADNFDVRELQEQGADFDLFATTDGRLVDRFEASREFGVSSAENIPTTTLEQAAVEESLPVPESVDAAASFDSAIELALGQRWLRNRDLKFALQERVLAAAEAAGVDLSVDSEERREYLVRVGVRDALSAIEQNPNAVGWYDLKTRQALAVVSLKHPEIAKDPDARFAFVYILATTSNGLDVGINFKLAEKVYRAYKKDGRMPTDMGIGTSRGAVNKTLQLFNDLAGSWGIGNLRSFMLTDMAVGDIGRVDPSLKPGGEHVATQVRGAAIIGPKIGNGFFSNLYGMFDQLTMDRWLVRTWGRWTGTLLKVQPEQTQRAVQRLEAARLALSAKDVETVAALIRQTRTPFVPADVATQVRVEEMSTEELAFAIQKMSMMPKNRTRMNKTAAGSELRKAGNSLAGYLDAQKEDPASPTERNQIRAVFAEILSELQMDPQYADLTMADLQAVMWYAEKRLYETSKDDLSEGNTDGYEDTEAPDYANAAVAVAQAGKVKDSRIQRALKREEDGRPRAARPRDEGQEAPVEGQPEEARGFTPGERKRFLGGLATLNARSNRGGGSTIWGYSRRTRQVRGGDGLLEWTPGKGLRRIYKSAGVVTPTFVELESTPENAFLFADAVESSRAGSEYGAAVRVYPAEDYQGMRLILSESGQSGVAIKPDGDIVSLFSSEGSGRSVVEVAIAAGGTRADAFDTVLPHLYSAHGLKVESRLKWNDKESPDGWDKNTFRMFNNGEPDIVFMVVDPEYASLYQGTEGVKSKSYDSAVRVQRKAERAVARRTTLEQAAAAEKPPRGGLEFDENLENVVLSLTEAHDLSTVLHEFGHLWFLEMLHDIRTGVADEKLQLDVQAALDYFALDENMARALEIAQAAAEKWAKGESARLETAVAVPEITMKDLEDVLAARMDYDPLAASVSGFAATGFHEVWAKSFEAYLLEGKAPSVELQSAFDTFMLWLLDIYTRLFKDLGVELNPEIRGVFDRMLATEEQIAVVRSQETMQPVFESAESAGISEAGFAEYLASVVRGGDRYRIEEAKKYLVKVAKLSREVKRAARERIQAQVEADINSQPVHRAEEWLKTGVFLGVDEQPTDIEHRRLNRESLVQLLGEEAEAKIRRLPFGRFGVWTSDPEKGIDPTTVAEMFEFSSPEELVDALIETPSRRERIRSETDRLLAEEYGDLSDRGFIAEEALARMEGEPKGSFLLRELNILAARAGAPGTPQGVARRIARGLIKDRSLRQVRPDIFMRAEQRLMKELLKAVQEEDWETAHRAAMERLVAWATTQEARKIRKENETAERYLNRLKKKPSQERIGKAGGEFLPQINQLLFRFGFRSEGGGTDRQDLAQWITKMQLPERESTGPDQKGMPQASAFLFDPMDDDLPDEIRFILDEGNTSDWRDLTTGQAEWVRDTIKNIEAQARNELRSLTDAKKRHHEEIVGLFLTSLEENARFYRPDPMEPRIDPKKKHGRGPEDFIAGHRKFASLLAQFDGKLGGPWWEVVLRTMNERGDFEVAEMLKAGDKFEKLMEPLFGGKKYRGQRLLTSAHNKISAATFGRADVLRPELLTPRKIKGAPHLAAMSQMGRIMAVLNMGNEANWQRLRDGFDLNDSDLHAIKDELSKEEMDFVQGVWNFIHEYWAPIVEKQKRVTGVAPKGVEAVPLETRHGTYPGGYFPIQYEPLLSARSHSDNQADVQSRAMKGAVGHATTWRPHTKERVARVVGRPIRLDFSVITSHITDVVHDLAWHEWLIDTTRIFADERIAKAIREGYGESVLEQARAQMRHIAGGDIAPQKTGDRILTSIRMGSAIAGMGWNMITGSQQVLGLANSAERIGYTWVTRGLTEWGKGIAHREHTLEWIYSMSSFMETRSKTMNRELAEQQTRITTGTTNAQASFFYLIVKMQQTVDVPTWLGAYHKEMETGSGDQARAAAMADQAVRDSQGSGNIADLAEVQRGTPFHKNWSLYYGYFSATLQLLAERHAAARTVDSNLIQSVAKNPILVGRLAATHLTLAIVPAVAQRLMVDLLRDNFDEDETVAGYVMGAVGSFYLNLFLFIREGAGFIEGYYGYDGPAGTRIFSAAGDLARQAAQGEFDRNFLKAAIQFGGIWSKLPAVAVDRLIFGVEALSVGATDNLLAPVSGLGREERREVRRLTQ